MSVILDRFKMKLEFYRHILAKYSNITFLENPSSGSRVVPWWRKDGWRTDRQTDKQTGRQTDKTKLIVIFAVLRTHLNTFAASYLNTQGLNNSCLKSPASTLVDLTFQSRTLRSFSLNQYVTCHYKQETYTAPSVYLADIIFIPFIVQYVYIAI